MRWLGRAEFPYRVNHFGSTIELKKAQLVADSHIRVRPSELSEERNMAPRKWGIVLVVVGVLMLAAVLLVSPLHIYGTGFGPKHIIGTIVSAVVLVAGIVAFLISKQKSASN